jgi:hypothetical protein
MQDQNTTKLADAIGEAEKRLAARGLFGASDVARSAIEALARENPREWAAMRDELVLALITATAQRRMTARAFRTTDSRQGWLELPEYARIPQLLEIGAGFLDVNEATLEQYRESEAELRARIRSYHYPRRSEEKLKRDKETLAQMRKLDKSVSPLMAGAPEMKMGLAIQTHLANLETPATQQRRKAIKRAMQRRHSRT